MILVASVLLASGLACGIYLIAARRWRILASPDERGAHRVPTPHGGGAPMMLVFLAGFMAAGYLAGPWGEEYTLVTFLAAGFFVLGILDDLLRLRVCVRLVLYALGCTCTVILLAPVMPDWVASMPAVLPVVVLSLALLWLVNLYNFMDGIDGIAASQCVFVCAASAGLSVLYGTDPALRLYLLLLAAVHLGFLVWNWPPARLFMGDAGSIPTGFLLGALALTPAARQTLPFACWLILGALFITDATWTILRRLLRGERVAEAHDSHLYQRLARHSGGHRPVVLAMQAINIIWLLPLAALAGFRVSWGPALVILAYLPLLFTMAKFRKLA